MMRYPMTEPTGNRIIRESVEQGQGSPDTAPTGVSFCLSARSGLFQHALFHVFLGDFCNLVDAPIDSPRRLCRFSVTVFGSSMVLLYFSSGLFHGLMLPRPELRFFQKLDQSAIFLLIAGTCTPVMLILLTGWLRRWLLGAVWTMAAVGIGCLWLLPKMPHTATVGIYMGMGWFGLAGIWQYYMATGWRGMSWMMAGAALYTLGAIFELAKWPVIWPGVVQAHEMLHICDMGGTYCHVVFIMRYVIVYRPVNQSAVIEYTLSPKAQAA